MTQDTPPIAGADDEAQIRKIHEQLLDLWHAEDSASLARLYTEDALLMDPNVPSIRGPDAIGQYYRTCRGRIYIDNAGEHQLNTGSGRYRISIFGYQLCNACAYSAESNNSNFYNPFSHKYLFLSFSHKAVATANFL